MSVECSYQQIRPGYTEYPEEPRQPPINPAYAGRENEHDPEHEQGSHVGLLYLNIKRV